MVCIAPDDGLFLPINTRHHFRPCFPILREPDHEWLDHDSHVECNIIEYDEMPVEESLRDYGIVGRLALRHADDVIAGVEASGIAASYVGIVRRALGAPRDRPESDD